MELVTPQVDHSQIFIGIAAFILIILIEGAILYALRYKKIGHSIADAVVINLTSGLFLVIFSFFTGNVLVFFFLVPMVEMLLLAALALPEKRDLRLIIAALIMNVPFFAIMIWRF